MIQYRRYALYVADESFSAPLEPHLGFVCVGGGGIGRLLAARSRSIARSWRTGAGVGDFLRRHAFGFRQLRHIGNSLVVNYDPQNNYVQWDRAGTTAVILI